MASARSRGLAANPTKTVLDPAGEPELAYIYGIVPSSTRLPSGLTGVGGSERVITLVRHQRIGAITSALTPDSPLGTPADLRAHANVLEALTALVPVLPVQFGGIITDRKAVKAELLAPHHDEFAARLDLLDGHDQFTIKGSYLGDTALREVLMAEPDMVRLVEELRGADSAASRDQRIRLGERIARGLDSRRAADTDELIEKLAPHASAVAEPSEAGPKGGVRASFLVRRTRRRDFEDAAEELGEQWDGRIRLRLLGPLAPFDFAQPLPAGG